MLCDFLHFLVISKKGLSSFKSEKVDTLSSFCGSSVYSFYQEIFISLLTHVTYFSKTAWGLPSHWFSSGPGEQKAELWREAGHGFGEEKVMRRSCITGGR